MKNSLIVLVFLLIFAACQEQKGIVLSNSTDVDLIQKSTEIERSDLEAKLGKIDELPYAFLIDKNGTKFPAQLDDLDGDGLWDVLFTQIDLKAGESVFYTLDFFVDEQIPVKTNIRFADKNDAKKEFETAQRLKSNATAASQVVFQMEGPAWENDVVAFRNYFDARNGIDIYGKTTTEMAMDECGLKDGPSYHKLQPWGMDILKVGNSLGAGAIAIETETGLHRIGPDCEGSYQLVKEGPLRSIFDFYFEEIEIDNQKVSLIHRISIEAGKPYYKSQVWVKGIDDAKLVTGIVNLHSDSVYSIMDEKVSCFYTHDHQAYDGEMLGMAVLVPSNEIKIETAPEEGEGITQTFYTSLDIVNQPVEFYFMVGWEKQNAVYSSKEGFENEILKVLQSIPAY